MTVRRSQMASSWVIGAVVCSVGGTIFVGAMPDTRRTIVGACRTIGLAAAEPTPPEWVDLIIDASPGSSGTLEHVEQTLDVLLPHLASAPGSVLRVIIQGTRGVDATMIGTVTSTAPTRSNRKAKQAHAKQFVATSRELLLQAIQSTITPTEVPRASPIVETIGWVALLSRPLGVAANASRRIVLITDAREVSPAFGDFECGTLPTSAVFLALLRTHDVLHPGVLAGADLHFTFTEPHPVARKKCPAMTVARIKGIQDLWIAAARTAGARGVTFDSAALNLAPREEENRS